MKKEKTFVVVCEELFLIDKATYKLLYEKYNSEIARLEKANFWERDNVRNLFLDSIKEKAISKHFIEDVYYYA